MSGDTRRCLRKLLLGIGCVCLLDLALGETSRHLFFAQRSGKFYRLNTAMEAANERIVVFGSSHAASHYVPEVLQQQLGMSCYNAGMLGQQILFHKTLESILLQRTVPGVIILDVDPSTLYESGEAYRSARGTEAVLFPPSRDHWPSALSPISTGIAVLAVETLSVQLYDSARHPLRGVSSAGLERISPGPPGHG